MKVKNPTCFNTACSKNFLKCSKTCYFAHFSLENSNLRAITHAITKTQAPVTIIIFSVAKMKLENKLCPHRRYGFQILHHEPFYSVFPIQINSKIEIRGSNPCHA